MDTCLRLFIHQSMYTNNNTYNNGKKSLPPPNDKGQDRELLGSLLFFFFFSPCQDHDGLHRRSLPILLKHR